MVAANAEMKVSFLAPVAVGSVLTVPPRWWPGVGGWPSWRPAVTTDDGTLVARASSTYLFRQRG